MGLIDRVPRILGVQAAEVDPIAAAFETGALPDDAGGDTMADSIDVPVPRNWRKAIRGVRASGGSMMTVSDEEILEGVAVLARATGVFGEPAGVTAFAGP